MAAPLPASAPAPSDPIICKLQAIASPESSHEAPLAVLWGRCYTIYTDLDHLTAQAVRSEEAVSTLAACLDLLTLSEQRVENQGIFSSNESEEDLSTGDMRYLLVPFYAAELLSNSPARPGPAGQAQRASAVRKAQRTYGRFLARAEQYQMLGELGSSIFKALESSGGAMDANTRRSLKVDKFKREKALKSAINELQDKQAAAAAKEQVGCDHVCTCDAASAWRLACAPLFRVCMVLACMYSPMGDGYMTWRVVQDSGFPTTVVHCTS